MSNRLPWRIALFSLLVVALMPATSWATPPSYAMFDASVARIKQNIMSNPEQALVSAEQAVAIARQLPPSPRAGIAQATADWLHGEALMAMNQSTRALPIIEDALRSVERLDPKSKLHGDLLRSRGALSASVGNVLDALKDYQAAHGLFQLVRQRRSQAIALQDIGMIYQEAGDYERTLDYYEESAEAFDDDPGLTLTLHNNRAEVFRKQKRYTDAANAYNAALRQARKLGSPLLQTRILTNLAGSEAEAGYLESAQAAVDEAIRLSSHGEAAGWQPFVYGVAAKVALQRGQNQYAAQLLTRTFRNVDLAKTEMVYREYHQTAARVFEALGDDHQALAHLKAFERLDSEAQALTASAASQLIAARFDFANQDLKISRLKEDQLKRDVEMERQRSNLRFMLLTGLLAAGAVVLALVTFGLVSIRRSRNEVRQTNATLKTVNEALESALKAKTEFLATTSHEIRTPLNGILGMTQVLLQDRRVEADIRERIEVVHGAGETMRALVDDILDVAKMETGLLTVVREPVDLRSVLSDATKLWSSQAEAKGVRFAVDIGDVPKRIMSDAGRLRQIAFNLMSNALKFTQDGRVTLSAAAIAAADGEEQLVIRVTDTGIGIPADKLETIFEPFRQVDGGITRQYGGTGLGLAIVRNLVLALGGEISVESVLGQGTSFIVRLPLERVEVDAGGAEPLAPRRTLEKASLLIVERDASKLTMLRLLLAAHVGRTEVVADLPAAVAAVAAGGITHVLADADAIARNDPQQPDQGSSAVRTLAAAAMAGEAHLTLLASAGHWLDGVGGLSQIVMKPVGASALLVALEEFYAEESEDRGQVEADAAMPDQRLAA